MCQELACSRDENTQGTSRTEVLWKQVQPVHTLGEDTISVIAHYLSSQLRCKLLHCCEVRSEQLRRAGRSKQV